MLIDPTSSALRVSVEHLEPHDVAAAGAVIEAAFDRRGMAARARQTYAMQPQHWFCARWEGEIVAAVGAYAYVNSASVGMMAVRPDMQGRGIGYQLMAVLVAHLEGSGYRDIFLEASAAGARLYPKLGFHPKGRTLRMLSAPLALPIQAAGPNDLVRPMATSDLPAVIAYDGRIFGIERPRVIQWLLQVQPARALVVEKPEGNLLGFLMSTPSGLGPWAADDAATAGALLQAGLALAYESGARVTFPAENAEARALLAAQGFQEGPELIHMRRGGGADPRLRQHYYGQASLMLG